MARRAAGDKERESDTPDLAVEEVSPRNTLNDLTAREWISESVSVWTQRGLGSSHPDAAIERQHPAPFSYTDISRVVRLLSKTGDMVLDPFVGVGSTLKACALEGRRGVGIELNPRYADLAAERLQREVPNARARSRQKVLVGDVRDLLPTMRANSVDLVVTSPPYWNILRKEDHKARQERKNKGLDTRYGDDPRDLGNISSYEKFLDELAAIFGMCGRVLKTRRYAAVVVSDFRDGGRYRMFHADLAYRLEEHDLVLKGVIVLHQRHKRVFPYGYPTAYVPNIHHQQILVLRNER